jgi:GNAT superfamily N-acetyltransferase
VPFMLVCTAQWNGYVPATVNTRLFEPPPGMFEDMPHELSSSWTRWGTVSPFVHVITSPTLALRGCVQVLSATLVATTVVPVESAQGPEAAVVAAGAVVGVAVPEHAARTRAVDRVAMPRRLGRMTSSWGFRCTRHDSATHAASTYGSSVGGVRIFDSDLARRLVIHEATAQQTPARRLRDLGDGWLFHDPSDAEPFWNRLIAPAWPSEPTAFDRRLDEVVTLFASLGRLPHIRPLPLGGSPSDLAQRLSAAGFETLGSDRRMVLARHGDGEALVAAMTARVSHAFGGESEVTVRRRESFDAAGRDVSTAPSGRDPDADSTNPGWADRRRWAVDASLVLADAFDVDPDRRVALENDLLACVSRPGCAVLLVSIGGVPAAIARRATTEDGSYLSSIGTRPAFRGRGLGALATALAIKDALDAGSPIVHLAVDVENEPALRLYERLGFATVGEASPDMLLR